jgi:peptide chain release factor subunit 3
MSAFNPDAAEFVMPGSFAAEPEPEVVLESTPIAELENKTENLSLQAKEAPPAAEPAPETVPVDESTAIDENDPERDEAPVQAKSKRPHDGRDHVNVVFIGHVDAGKSTISGNIL